MGKSGGGQTAAGRIGEQFAERIMKQGAPARRQVFQQLNEAMATGNIEAKVPIIQNMVEGGLQQGSQALKMTYEDIAKSGAGRTPAAVEQQAGLRSMAQQAVAQIPGAVIGQTIQGGPDALAGTTNAALGLLGAANTAQSAAMQAKAQQQAQTATTAGSAAAAVGIIAAIAI